MPIRGFDEMWDAHPEWLDRYDFAIATAPVGTWYQHVVEGSSEQEVRAQWLELESERVCRPSSPALSSSPSSTLSAVSSLSSSSLSSASSTSSTPSTSASASACSACTPHTPPWTRSKTGSVRYKCAQPTSPILATWFPGVFGSTQRLYYTHFLWCDDEARENHPGETEVEHEGHAEGSERSGCECETDAKGGASVTDPGRKDAELVGDRKHSSDTNRDDAADTDNVIDTNSLHVDTKTTFPSIQPYPTQGGYHCLTRADLVGAFEYLVNNAEEVYHAHADLHSAIVELASLKGTPGEFDGLLDRAKAELGRIAVIATATSNATEYYGKYLSHLSDLERTHRLPRAFLPTHLDDGEHHPGAWRPVLEDLYVVNGTVVDSFAFIVAERWVRSGRRTMCERTDAEIRGARKVVDLLQKEMYGVMRREVPPPWDRRKRRTDVVELWEQQRASG